MKVGVVKYVFRTFEVRACYVYIVRNRNVVPWKMLLLRRIVQVDLNDNGEGSDPSDVRAHLPSAACLLVLILGPLRS